MSEEIPETGLYIAMHGLSVEALMSLASWHRSLAAKMHARPELDDRDVMAAAFELRISKALTVYADAREAGRALRLQSKFEAVLTQGGIDVGHEPEEDGA
jgi:aspartate oxidase